MATGAKNGLCGSFNVDTVFGSRLRLKLDDNRVSSRCSSFTDIDSITISALLRLRVIIATNDDKISNQRRRQR